MKSYFKFLSRNKVYTAINVLGLALSMMFLLLIAAYTWQETHIDTWHRNARRTYMVGCKCEGEGFIGSHWRIQHRLRDHFPEIENSCAIISPGSNQVRREGAEEYRDISTNIIFVDSTFFSVFDFKLEEGDPNTALNAKDACIITRQYARKQFGDENPIGQRLTIDNTTMVVTAIVEPMKRTAITGDDNAPIDLIGRFEQEENFNPACTSDGMNNATGAAVYLVGDHLDENTEAYSEYAKTFFWFLQMPGREVQLTLTRLDKAYLSGLVRSTQTLVTAGNPQIVKILFSAGLVILVFALINYINLTVAQSTRRAKEMATRRLLGSSRGGIVARLVAEGTLMVLVSFAIGLGLAQLMQPYAAALLGTPVALASLIDPAVIGTGVAILAATGVAAGIIPATIISSVKPIDVVRGSFKRQNKTTFSRIFIVLQNVVTIVMLASALTMYLQLKHLVEAPMGYDKENVMQINGLGRQSQKMKQRLEQLGCVESISLSRGTPYDGGNNETFSHNGRTLSFQIIEGDRQFIDLFGITVEKENGGDGVYVNHQALDEMGLDENAASLNIHGEQVAIRGIVKDFHIRTILDETHPMAIVIRNEIEYPWSMSVKTKGDPMEAWRQIDEASSEVWEGQARLSDYFDVPPYIDNLLKQHFKAIESMLHIVGIFAIVAMLISLLGLVAMSYYYVGQRSQEVAVRKVFGSTSEQVLKRIIGSFLLNVAAAIVAAIPATVLIMGDWLSNYSYRIELHWWIFAAASLLCLFVSFVAVVVQSAVAANANPVKALYQN